MCIVHFCSYIQDDRNYQGHKLRIDLCLLARGHFLKQVVITRFLARPMFLLRNKETLSIRAKKLTNKGTHKNPTDKQINQQED